MEVIQANIRHGEKTETSFEQKVSHKTTNYDSLKRSLCEKSYY